MVLALTPPALVHPKCVLQRETEKQGTRKASRIWPCAVQVPEGIGLTKVFLLFCGGGVSHPTLHQILPAAARERMGQRGASGDKPAEKCFSGHKLSPAAPQAGRGLS